MTMFLRVSLPRSLFFPRADDVARRYTLARIHFRSTGLSAPGSPPVIVSRRKRKAGVGNNGVDTEKKSKKLHERGEQALVVGWLVETIRRSPLWTRLYGKSKQISGMKGTCPVLNAQMKGAVSVLTRCFPVPHRVAGWILSIQVAKYH